ncbi:flagellar hook assembly protein FlgD [Panacagrimonas sp.]|uniref:flagellar hook assembly protein FlgD n=1 Tax=Panacagrimonas sp. TaxID=2480088 RepID=UPI003B52B091
MNVGGSTSNPYTDLGLGLRQAAPQAEMGQADFLRLMTTQLQYQDPFKPMESGEFLGQIAQFSTVSGIQGMQESLDSLAAALTSNQTLQAASLVGRGVLVPGDGLWLPAEGAVELGAELPASGSLLLEIRDAGGQVVDRVDLGSQPAGVARITWDGTGADGARLPEGAYSVSALLASGDAGEQVQTLVSGTVNSVSTGSSGLLLHLNGLDPVELSAVRQIL